MSKQVRKGDNDYVIMEKISRRSADRSTRTAGPSKYTAADYVFSAGYSGAGGTGGGSEGKVGISAVVINSSGDPEVRQEQLIIGNAALTIIDDTEKAAFILTADEYTNPSGVFDEI